MFITYMKNRLFGLCSVRDLLKTVYSANDPRQLPTAHAVGAGEAGPSGVS